jgi:predicted dehydrogenase
MNEAKTRYGILGFGHHAIKRLMPSFAKAGYSRVEGLWRRDLTKATENARTFSIPQVFRSAEELCQSPDIDAVFVVSPDALHLEHVLLALSHGKAVLCEKPLAMSVAEAEQMLAAAAKAGRPLGVAQNMRYNRSVELMQAWIREGRIGAPVVAHAQFCYESERSPRTWINDPELARGGPIGDVGIHCMDALTFVLDAQVTAVNTLAHRDDRSGEVESHAIVSLDFASGAMAAVTVSTRAAYRSLIEVTGESGVLVCEAALTVDHPAKVALYQGGRVAAEETVSNDDAFSRMLDSFALSLRGESEYRAGAEQGVRNQRVLDAAYASWHTGKRMEV